MKKLRALLAIPMLLMIFTTGCSGSSAKSEYDDGKMRSDLTAMTCAKEMGIGINLGNTFEAYWADENNMTSGAQMIGENTPQDYETCWGAVVTTQECIDGMKAAGFNTVRLPVYWGNMMEDDGKYTISEAYLDRVREVVDYCRKDDLYVIINVHHYDEFLIKNHTKEETLAASAHIWEQIADYFKDYSDYLLFEGYNEALGSYQEDAGITEDSDEAFAYVNEMNQVFVDTVRKSGGNNASRILIVSGYWTNIDKTTSESYQMPTDTASDKMMVSVHYIDNAIYWTNQVGGDSWENYSTEQCNLLKDKFTDNHIPVFIGECTSSASYTADHFASNAEYTDASETMQYILDMAVDYGFVPVIWDTNNSFYSRTECKIKLDADQTVITEIVDKIKNS